MIHFSKTHFKRFQMMQKSMQSNRFENFCNIPILWSSSLTRGTCVLYVIAITGVSVIAVFSVCLWMTCSLFEMYLFEQCFGSFIFVSSCQESFLEFEDLLSEV